MSDKLLPCPFCGQSEIEIFPCLTGFVTVCASCNIDGAMELFGKTEHQSILAWNTRTPPPAINQELFTAQRQYANAQRNFEYYYDLYRKVSGKTIAECEKQWSVDTLDGQIGLEKHAAAVKHSQEQT